MSKITDFRTKDQVRMGLLLEGTLNGDRADKNAFFEALTTSDLPTLLEPAINRKVRETYEGIPSTWDKVANKELVDDFRLQEVVRTVFGDGTILPTNVGKSFYAGGLPKIGELGEYPMLSLSASGISYKIGKSGVKAALSWEAIINGRSISILERFYTEFAKRAAKQNGFEVYGQFVNGSGFTSWITGASNDATLSGNPALSIAALKLALAQAYTHTMDSQRIPSTPQFELVVAPALELAAREILSITEVTTTSGSVTTKTANPIEGKFELVVADEVTQINSGAGAYWWIQPKPGTYEDGNVSLAFLRGHETPEVFVKSTTLQNPMDGDFDHDDIQTKVRHTATGVAKNLYGVVASTGAGS
jgi:hypothetical protein